MSGWNELIDLPKGPIVAFQDRFEAASSLDQARLKRRELEGISKEKSAWDIQTSQWLDERLCGSKFRKDFGILDG